MRQTRVPNRGFGVEFECIASIGYSGVEDAINGAGYTYGNESRDHWTVKDDCSIYRRGNRGSSVEFTTPVLYGRAGISEMRNVLRRVRQGATVNRSCGTHVHIDANDYDIGALRRLAKVCYMYENIIYGLTSASRNSNNYCNKMRDSWSSATGAASFDDYAIEGRSRYYGVNLQSYTVHGSIEFRMHQGTLNPQKIKHWVIFLLKLVQKCKEIDRLPRGFLEGSYNYSEGFHRLMEFVGIGTDTRTYLYLANRMVELLDRRGADLFQSCVSA